MSNKMDKTTVEIYTQDALMIVHALMIGSNTAMMSGHYGAKERLKYYQKVFGDLIDPAARIFGGEEWSEICMCLANPDTVAYKVSITIPSYKSEWRKEGWIAITFYPQRNMKSTRVWYSDDSEYKRGDERFEAVKKLLKEIAPLTVMERQDDDGSESKETGT